eukprot:scaffold10068_cov134-Skeletonema_marinoi.AAC.2
MSARNKDGSLNTSLLERQVREDMAIYSKSRAEDSMKKRALHTCQGGYDEFKNFVSVSQLKPISGNDVSSLFNGSSGSLPTSTFRNRTVHGASTVQSGIGCLDGYIDEKKKDGEVVVNDDKDKKKNVEVTTKSRGGKVNRSSTKSSRDAYNFLARWKRQCSSSASDTLTFLVHLEEVPETTCQLYFSTDIDSDVVGDIVCALHLLMCVARDKNGHNDDLVAELSSAELLSEPNTTKFISSWLEAMTGCGRFDLALSFLTTKQELQLKEMVQFVKNSVYTDGADKVFLHRYNNLFKS